MKEKIKLHKYMPHLEFWTVFFTNKLIKKRAFESFSQYYVFDGWNTDKPVNARVIVLTAIQKSFS